MDPLNLKMLVVANALPPAFSGIIISLLTNADTYVATGTSSLTLPSFLHGLRPLVDLDNRYLHQNVLLTRRFIDIAADILLTGRENPDGFSRPFFCRGVKSNSFWGKNFLFAMPQNDNIVKKYDNL